jgi:hypothetical protein
MSDWGIPTADVVGFSRPICQSVREHAAGGSRLTDFRDERRVFAA